MFRRLAVLFLAVGLIIILIMGQGPGAIYSQDSPPTNITNSTSSSTTNPVSSPSTKSQPITSSVPVTTTTVTKKSPDPTTPGNTQPPTTKIESPVKTTAIPSSIKPKILTDTPQNTNIETSTTPKSNTPTTVPTSPLVPETSPAPPSKSSTPTSKPQETETAVPSNTPTIKPTNTPSPTPTFTSPAPSISPIVPSPSPSIVIPETSPSPSPTLTKMVPVVTSFDVQPRSITEGEPVTITFSGSDPSGTNLQQVEIRRTSDLKNWPPDPIYQAAVSGSKHTGQYIDNDLTAGTYWYRVRYSNLNGFSKESTPIQVLVKEASPAGNMIGLNKGTKTIKVPADTWVGVVFPNPLRTVKITKVEILVDDPNPTGSVRIGVYDSAPCMLIQDLGEAPVVNGWVTFNDLDVDIKSSSELVFGFILEHETGIRAIDSPDKSTYSVAYPFGPLLKGEWTSNDVPPGGTTSNNKYVIRATVAPTYFIIASAGAGGTITPSGTIEVKPGSNQSFVIKPDSGYTVADVLVDGVSAGKVNSYTFNNVTVNHSISVSFAPMVKVSTAEATNVTETSATLNGQLSPWPTIAPQMLGFEYGKTTDYGKEVRVTQNTGSSVPSDTPAAVFSANISALHPGTIYHYRAKAVISGKTYYGEDKTFTTQPSPTNVIGLNSGTDTIKVPADTLNVMGFPNNFGRGKITKIELLVDDLNPTGKLRMGVYSSTPTLLIKDLGEVPLVNGWVSIDDLNIRISDGPKLCLGFILETPNGIRIDQTPGCYSAPWPYGPLPMNKWSKDVPPNGKNLSYRYVMRAYVTLDTNETHIILAMAEVGGKISPSGGVSVNSGADQTFTIIPDPGYATKDVLVDTQSQGRITSYTFSNVTSSHNMVAFFTPVFTLQTDTSSFRSGQIIENPDKDYYEAGELVELKAVPADGYSFTGWSGDLHGNENPQTIKMTESKAVMAIFTKNTYTLNTKAIGNGTIKGNPSGIYNYGDVIQLTAAPDPGWTFAHWSGDVSGTENPKTITIKSNMSVTANFARTYTLNVNQNGSGTVSLNPPGGNYISGTSVQLTATAEAGWTFKEWGGDVYSTDNPVIIYMDKNKTISAIFTAQPSVSTKEACEVTDKSVILNGELIGLGSASEVQVYFEYGTTTDYGKTTEAKVISDPGTFIIELTGLEPDTNYHYRALAVGDGTIYGEDVSFRTKEEPIEPPVTTPEETENKDATQQGDIHKTTIITQDFTSNTNVEVNINNIIENKVELKTRDEKVAIEIQENTKLQDAQGKVPQAFTINVLNLPADDTSGQRIIQAYELGPEGAVFDPPITLTLTYDLQILPSGVSENDLMIAGWDGTRWNALESQVDTLSKTVSARIQQFGRYALMAPLVVSQSPQLVYSGLLITPNQVEPNGQVTIQINIVNTGKVDGEATVELKINAEAVGSQKVTVSAGQSQIVVFAARPEAPGAYTVEVNGNTGQFTVHAASTTASASPETSDKPQSVSPLMILVPAVTIMIIGLIVGLVMYRRRAR